MRDTLHRLGRWVLEQAQWRNLVRLCGLGGMMWLTLTQAAPSPEALVALGAMIGLPSFGFLVPVDRSGRPKE